MFVHVAKDFLRKIDEVEKRLDVSLDRDEIQTLGLKLRFYYNEMKHYQNLMKEVTGRILEVQNKFGFKPEEESAEAPPAAVSVSPVAAAPVYEEESPALREPAPPAPIAKKEKPEDVVGLVSAWISRLEEEGVDPRDVLKGISGDSPRKEDEELKHTYPIPKKETEERQPEKQEAPAAPAPARSMAGFSARNVAAQYMKTVLDTGDEDAQPRAAQAEHEYQRPAWMEEPEAVAVPQTAMPLPEDEPDPRDRYEVPDMAELEKTLEEAKARLAAREAKSEYRDGRGFSVVVDDAAAPEIYEPVEERPAANIQSPSDLGIVVMEIKNLLKKGAPEQLEALESMERLCREAPVEVHTWLSGLTADDETGFFDNEDRAELEFCAGYLAAGIGMTGTAINRLETAFSLGLTNSNGKTLLSDLYYIKGIFGKALKGYREAEDASGPTSATAIGVIRCLRELQRLEELAAEVERREFVDENERLEALCFKAEALIGLGRTSEATGLLDGLIQIAARPAWKARLMFLKAKVMESKGDAVAATDCYEMSLELDGDNPEALFALGRLYLQHRAMPLGKSRLSALVKKFPESPWADQARALMDAEGVL